MQLHLAMLLTDWLIYILFFCTVCVFFYARHVPHLRDPWRRVLANKVGMISATILSFYVVVGLLDSIHFQVTFPKEAYTVPETRSLLDLMLHSTASNDEQTYSAPFATRTYTQSTVIVNGKEEQQFVRLKFGGAHLYDESQKTSDILQKIGRAVIQWVLFIVVFYGLLFLGLSVKRKQNYFQCMRFALRGGRDTCSREVLLTFGIITLIIFSLMALYSQYHIMGTDKVGHDVFYASIKSIRTGLLIGTLTTIFMLPFALILGMVAGFFSGWIDDAIQYLYTTLSSIPAVLLISASILVLQVYIARHVDLFPTLSQRADARLLALCFVLGITGWSALCRLLRAETLKIRELEFVQAARVLGVGRMMILFKHIMPNLMHIILITIVLDFSMLVLAEAVLSYVGVGVDPTTFSWGNMINSSRLELAREPMVWWPLGSALIFMFFLVLSANLFSDAVRDALDPRIRTEVN